MIMKNQLLNLKMIALMCLMMVLGGANVWAEQYKIVFAKGTSDNSTAMTNKTSKSDVISSGVEYVASFNTCINVFNKSKNGLKIGKGAKKNDDGSGTIEFSIADGYQKNIKKITIKSAKWVNNQDKSDTGTLTLYNGTTSLKSGITPGTDYTHTFDAPTTVSSIKLSTSAKRAYISEIILETEEANNPTLVASETALDFGSVENNTSKDLTFKLSGTKLTANATLSVAGDYFTVTPTSVAQTDGTIPETDVTVSYNPTAVGSHTATLTISSTGATDKTITLTGTSANAYNVAWSVNGKAYSEGTPTTKVVDGEKVTVLPTTPSDVNGKVFVGWTNSEIAAEQNDAPSVLFTSVDDAPVVLHNITYYAVFAKAGGKVVEAETEDTKFDNSYKEYCGVNNGLKNVGNGIKKNKIWDALSNEVVKLKVYHVSNGEADVLTLALINENGKVVTSKDIETTELGNSTKAAGYSAYVELQANSSVTGYSVTLKTLNSYGTSVGKVTREVVEGTSGYCTTVAAAAEPTYTKQTPVTFRAEDNGDYYATFSNDKVTFITSDNSEAYKIVVSDGNIVKTKLDEVSADINGKTVKGFYIPANTGVLLYSIVKTADYYTVENKTVDAISPVDNMLEPAPKDGGYFAFNEGYKYYKLAYNDYTAKTGLGFYWGADNGGAFYVKAGTAYLAVPEAKAAGAKGFTLNGEATGIEGVNANVENAKAIYNLNGQRVASMAKPGLYIVNGKKVVRK